MNIKVCCCTQTTIINKKKTISLTFFLKVCKGNLKYLYDLGCYNKIVRIIWFIFILVLRLLERSIWKRYENQSRHENSYKSVWSHITYWIILNSSYNIEWRKDVKRLVISEMPIHNISMPLRAFNNNEVHCHEVNKTHVYVVSEGLLVLFKTSHYFLAAEIVMVTVLNDLFYKELSCTQTLCAFMHL